MKLKKKISFNIAFLSFISLVLLVYFIFPIIIKQLTNLIQYIPNVLQNLKIIFIKILEEKNIEELNNEYIVIIKNYFSYILKEKDILKINLSIVTIMLPNIVSIIIYCILVPLCTMYTLKNYKKIIKITFKKILKNKKIKKIYFKLSDQIKNFIIGKLIEIFLITTLSYFIFLYINLNYTIILSLMIGMSTIVPYLGALIITIPIITISFMQWGISHDFLNLIILYIIILQIDSNILIPFLFGEVIKLKPTTILIYTIIFGVIGGIFGMFFAIPIILLIKTFIKYIHHK
jgi:putative permease